MNKIKLYNHLSVGYTNDKTKQREYAQKHNLQYIDTHSDTNHQVYLHPDKKIVYYNINGTQNLNDWGTDISLGLGRLKHTQRFKIEKSNLDDLRNKYQGHNFVISGHSLGGGLSQAISNPNDQVHTYNAAIIGRVSKNNTHHRTTTDAVSLLSRGSKYQYNSIYNPFRTPNTLVNIGLETLAGHNLENIKNRELYI